MDAFCVAFAPAPSESISAYPFAAVVWPAGAKAATGMAFAFVVIVQSPEVCGGVPAG